MRYWQFYISNTLEKIRHSLPNWKHYLYLVFCGGHFPKIKISGIILMFSRDLESVLQMRQLLSALTPRESTLNDKGRVWRRDSFICRHALLEAEMEAANGHQWQVGTVARRVLIGSKSSWWRLSSSVHELDIGIHDRAIYRRYRICLEIDLKWTDDETA